jgi:hypothetical protein
LIALCLLRDEPCDTVRGRLGLVGAADTAHLLEIYSRALEQEKSERAADAGVPDR